MMPGNWKETSALPPLAVLRHSAMTPFVRAKDAVSSTSAEVARNVRVTVQHPNLTLPRALEAYVKDNPESHRVRAYHELLVHVIAS